MEFLRSNIKKIIDVAGRTNIVFPPYKVKEKELKKIYKAFAEAMARKNLVGYDQMSKRNKLILEAYEMAVALLEVAEELLQEIKTNNSNKRLACIL